MSMPITKGAALQNLLSHKGIIPPCNRQLDRLITYCPLLGTCQKSQSHETRGKTPKKQRCSEESSS